jgi:hypothetical protein
MYVTSVNRKLIRQSSVITRVRRRTRTRNKNTRYTKCPYHIPVLPAGFIHVVKLPIRYTWKHVNIKMEALILFLCSNVMPVASIHI